MTSPCTWTEDADGVWETECKNAYQFVDGGPFENGQCFCAYCGKPLVAVRYTEPVDEDEQAELARQRELDEFADSPTRGQSEAINRGRK